MVCVNERWVDDVGAVLMHVLEPRQMPLKSAHIVR
jgi:hypothetical protein